MSKKSAVFGCALCATLLALCVPAQAQQSSKLWRVGYISGTGDAKNQGPYVEALRQGLRDLAVYDAREPPPRQS